MIMIMMMMMIMMMRVRECNFNLKLLDAFYRLEMCFHSWHIYFLMSVVTDISLCQTVHFQFFFMKQLCITFLNWIKRFKKNLWLGRIQLPLAFLDYPNAHLSNKEALLLKWKALSQEQFVFNSFHCFKSAISSFFITFIWNVLTHFTHTWCMQYQAYAIKCQCLSYN